jgi:hypothetical protein
LLNDRNNNLVRIHNVWRLIRQSTLSQNRRRRFDVTNVAQDAEIDADRAAEGKAPMTPKARQPAAKETKVSRADPEAGYPSRAAGPAARPLRVCRASSRVRWPDTIGATRQCSVISNRITDCQARVDVF